jgi:transcriptional regulator with XRE-family HTH domain
LPICNIQLKAKKPSYIPFPAKDDQSLGAELKRRRLTLEWTQKDTAKHFGVLKDSYQKWEWNQITPHIKNRKRVVEFLDFNYWDDGSNSLANKCLLYRIEYGLTHKQLATRLIISMATISRIENGKRKISNETIRKVEKLINFYKIPSCKTAIK